MIDKPVRKPRVFTLGHSDRSLDEFMYILQGSSIRLVADVRSNPASVRFPHFERSALSKELEKRGLVYRWFRDLGIRQRPMRGEEEHTAMAEESLRRYCAAMNTAGFHQTVEKLFGLLASTVTVVLCAERDFKRCHRGLLSDKLMVMGARVTHIQDIQAAEDHFHHPDLVVEGEKMIYRGRQLDLLSR
ncbi:MAG: DUF488 domain-containing protein [Proteobacteria bacterium]|nr:DUF488 domain-containing protein [Pseudomonadota bacterium]